MKTISVDNLFVDPQQSRSWESRIDEEFKESIERHGVINPLTVREKHTESKETAGKKGLPESPAGKQEYYVVAGRRRLDAAIEVGIHEIDCVVKDYDDEEAASVSLDENEQRKALTQLELAKSVKKRYDILKEDLVGEDETVECPECGKECNGRESIVQHLAQSDCDPADESSLGFIRKTDIFKQIAEDSSFDYKTVKRLINVASIPEQFQAFVKIPEERTSDDDKIVERLISTKFTFANEERESIVSQKTIDFARFVSGKPARLVELTLERRNFRNATTSETKEIFKEVSNAWEVWKDEDVEGDVGYNNSIKGKYPQTEEETEEDVTTETEATNTKEEQSPKHIEVQKEDDSNKSTNTSEEREKSNHTTDDSDDVEKDTSWTSDPVTPTTEETDSNTDKTTEQSPKTKEPVETEDDGWSENVDESDEEIQTALFATFGDSKTNKMFDGEYTSEQEKEIIEAIVNTVNEKTKEFDS